MFKRLLTARASAWAVVLLLSAGALGLASRPASATVFHFQPTFVTPSGLDFSISLKLAPGVYSVSGDKFSGDLSLFTFEFLQEDILVNVQRVRDICNDSDLSLCFAAEAEYFFSANSGFVNYNDTNNTLRLNYENGFLTGAFSTDAPTACYESDACYFEGRFAPVSEPATALVLLGGLAGFLALRRHR